MTFDPSPISNPSPLKPSLRFVLLMVFVGLSVLFASLTDTAEARSALDGRTLRAVSASVDSARPSAAAEWNGARIDWMRYDAGLARAQAEHKPVFLQVHAPWCAFCRQLRRQFFDPEIVRLSRDFVMVLVDMDENPAIAAAYRHDGAYVPRSMILTERGHLVARIDNDRAEYVYAIDGRSPRELRAIMLEAEAYFAASAKKQLTWPEVWRPH